MALIGFCQKNQQKKIDAINIFLRPFWPILAYFGHFWAYKVGSIFGADFSAKTRLGPYSREYLGQV
jgi:hypothetical protein